jgi:hypothetical protein
LTEHGRGRGLHARYVSRTVDIEDERPFSDDGEDDLLRRVERIDAENCH